MTCRGAPMSYALDHLVASPCCNPQMTLPEALVAYSRLGFSKFEAFTGWVRSALDLDTDPQRYIECAAGHGMRFTSLHLPPVEDDLDASVARAVRAAEFAHALGADVVLYKATSRENYVRSAGGFLDRTERLGITPVLQNHAGTPISTVEDFREVIDGIADPRMKTLLEVGHFYSVGASWREACQLLGDSIALVHVKDQVGSQSVPFGAGEIDLPGLFEHMRAAGYEGDFVVEMEVKDRENTLRYLAEAIEYLRENCL